MSGNGSVQGPGKHYVLPKLFRSPPQQQSEDHSRKTIRISDLQDSEEESDNRSPDINSAISQLEKQVKISDDSHRSPPSGSQSGSQPQSQSNSLPGSHQNSGYNTPNVYSRPMSPPIAPSPVSASAGGSAAPTRPVSAGPSENQSATASPTNKQQSSSERELHARVKQAAVQRARDLTNEGFRALNKEKYVEARDAFANAEHVFRDLNDLESAEEVAKQKLNAEAKIPSATATSGNVGINGNLGNSGNQQIGTKKTNSEANSDSSNNGTPSPSNDVTPTRSNQDGSPIQFENSIRPATTQPQPVALKPAPPVKCGVGISFTKNDSGESKITAIRHNSPADLCGQLQIGDTILKIDGVSVYEKSVEEIIELVLGPPNTNVQITIQTQYGFPHVMTAPFQELPFDLKKDKKRRKDFLKSNSTSDFLRPENRLYGGGRLPPGFEHLESLRSAQPYTTPSLSVRTVNLSRQLPLKQNSEASLDTSKSQLPDQPPAEARRASLVE
uniref:PDZ domain-containing protein n=1 Tax=Hanusia phi TaxID=3032 RepID=A0A7S0HXS6_9CRYP|mmetsp:Transcript_5893/g.13647  ORF Transcript_5893/g.13647 Transcript_5893/m.13647 type:complete len:500 (+) Transcript_5893:103-1602(+)